MDLAFLVKEVYALAVVLGKFASAVRAEDHGDEFLVTEYLEGCPGITFQFERESPLSSSEILNKQQVVAAPVDVRYFVLLDVCMQYLAIPLPSREFTLAGKACQFSCVA